MVDRKDLMRGIPKDARRGGTRDVEVSKAELGATAVEREGRHGAIIAFDPLGHVVEDGTTNSPFGSSSQ